VAALHYLAVFPGIARYDVLHRYRSQVIRELAKVLDDPKRSVRKEAVHARYDPLSFYLLIGSEMFFRTIWCVLDSQKFVVINHSHQVQI
jgi:DNA repair/transcription protein MET18/MMS19